MTVNQFAAADLMSNLDDRSREIFRNIVETYLESGEPLGSRTLARMLTASLSPASVRNVMSDLEELGLIYAPHISAGRLPTQKGLRFFVDAFMQVGDLQPDLRHEIESQVRRTSAGRPVETVLTEASQMLSGLSRGAGLVIAAKTDHAIRHIEFIRLDPQRALVVLVGDNDEVENRVMELPAGVTASQLTEAANYLNAHLAGRTMSEARGELRGLQAELRRELDELSSDLVERGLAVWAGSEQGGAARMIVRGRANLLDSLAAGEELDRLRLLFDELERKENLIELMTLAEEGSGVRIFIGSENKLFSLSGSSLIVAPYRDGENQVVGAVGIIGPTRLNYARIVPMVDYTAQLVSRILR
ncbi:heat-inducible transcriptional repressor HrcA [Pseudohoeflea coraliihabitans]|uniref:Heat-inducible transcription repressor HrcA n=1 Tax=Pseudohoeflea coraliihabitans TaxID=2860393 RepID=A0ABS6WPC1_9HYPH|nr:heat-inducible transcriptional repressor HrcA [Pseudohoeflea sp. DP4N28-3]MBW3097610.1 heat-inducible transcriptional repressor HrcA [Pseudohoeflea sp. DP4N28-3]